MRRQPDLIDFLLFEAHRQVERYFGPASQVELRFIRGDEEYPLDRLTGWIMTSYPSREAVNHLDALCLEWFLDQVDWIGERFGFMLGFK